MFVPRYIGVFWIYINDRVIIFIWYYNGTRNSCTRSWKKVVTEKCYMKDKIELINKLWNNDTENIGMLSSASKDVSVKFVDQRLQILNNKESLNGL